MRPRRIARRVVTTVAAALVVPLVAGGTSLRRGAEAGDRVRPFTTPSHAMALRSLDDCEQLRTYLVDVAVESVIRDRYGWGGWLVPWSSPGGAEDGAGASDFTTTNVQEPGVDELDLVKTDGRHLFVAQNHALWIVDAWPPDATTLVGSLDLGAEPHGLFRSGDLALVPSWSVSESFAPDTRPATGIDLVDVADPTAPRLVRSLQVDGFLVGARLVDGHAFVVLSSPLDLPAEVWELAWRSDLGLPELPPDATEEQRETVAEEARTLLRPLVADIFAELAVEGLLPTMTDSAGPAPGERRPLLTCDSLLAPADTASYAALTVLHLDLGAEDPLTAPLQATGLLAEGFTVYAAARSLYVAQGSWWWWGRGELDMTSAVHKFSLDPEAEEPVRYAATGEVDGWLLNQFSMSEHAGNLRVASTAVDWRRGTDADGTKDGSMVTVLRDDGRGGLQTVGRVSGIAPGEQIYAARFLGDVGYLVTFRQVDPLHTLDLSDPAAPRMVGELEVPGYSAYLHPVEGGRLLAVGMDGTPEGVLTGLAVSLFDVSDLAAPRLIDRYTLDGSEHQWSWSEALTDHHAFTFHRDVLSIPAYLAQAGEGSGFSGLLVLAVDGQEGISEIGRVGHDDLAPGGGWVAMRRSVYMEDALYSISSAGLKVNDLHDPAVLWAAVPLAPQ